MAELIASPALRAAPVTAAGCTLAPADPGPVAALALMPGQEAAAARLLAPLGLAFPAPNTTAVRGAARIVWTGRAQALVIGVPLGAAEGLAVFDQTDGWATLTLQGKAAAAALMRLVPLDLEAMAEGQAARAPVGHMQAVIWREAAGFTLMVFRSMARTAWHEIEVALAALAARQVLDARDGP